MPTFAFKTRTRTVSENCALDLVVQHRLVAGEPSNMMLVKKGPPQGIDIILVSPLTITISGMLNGTRMLPEQLKSSCIAQHLQEYLRMNSKELGMETISDPYIAEDTGLLTLVCTASWLCRSTHNQFPHLRLLGFDIDYIWHEDSPLTFPTSLAFDITLSPFSRQLALPFLAALNNVVERFITFQAVKRYPRIFGPWRQQLDMEQGLISSLFTSLRNILNRSPNLAFQKLYESQMKVLRMSISSSFASAEDALSNYLGTMERLDARGGSQLTLHDDDLAFFFAMERIYCFAMKRRTFKSVSSGSRTYCKDELIYDERTITDDGVDFNEEPYSATSEKEDGTRSREPPDLCEAFFSDYSSDPGHVDLDPDKSIDLRCRNSAVHWNDKEEFCTSTSYSSRDVLNQSPNSSLPEESRSSLCLDTHLDPAQVTSSVIYCDDEFLFSFNGDCLLNIESSSITEMASAGLTPFLDDVNIFEAETSELPPLVSSRLSPTCSSPSADAGTTAWLSERPYQDNLPSDGDPMRDDPHSQVISAETRCDITHDISGFNLTAIDDFGHGASRSSSLGNECVSGVLPVKGPRFPRRVESTVDPSLSGLHVLFDEPQYSNVCDALDRDMDFVAMDFGL